MKVCCEEIYVFIGHRLQASSESTSMSGGSAILCAVMYSTKAEIWKFYEWVPGRVRNFA